MFLAAINTLVGLADVAPSEALPLLAARLSDEAIATPLRLMLTEVLEKAARQCGDVLPHYAPLFVNAFLGTRFWIRSKPSSQCGSSSPRNETQLETYLSNLDRLRTTDSTLILVRAFPCDALSFLFLFLLCLNAFKLIGVCGIGRWDGL
eukprot:COSAG06_NODE_11058_length_1574_cov_11.707113_2_plen_149_part_00